VIAYQNARPMSFAPDKDMEITETIIDPVKSMDRVWEMVRSAKDEILILFSSANSFARQDRAGAVQVLKESRAKRKDLKIKILAPRSERVEELRLELKPHHIEVKYIQEFSQTKITILVVDRIRSHVVELKNDNTMNTLEAIGHSTYSTRILTVLSYVSILESYWALSELHEESANELAYTKEYLNKVLTEIKTNKNQLDN
jgi:two-component system, OmpR family, sensor histidine kinase VicK